MKAHELGCDAVIYNRRQDTWSAGSLTKIPERYRNVEVSHYYDWIVFSADLSSTAMAWVVKDMRDRIPIAPEDCLFLEIYCPGDTLRFSRRMAEVWHRLPSQCQYELRWHWQTDMIHLVGGPAIKYVDWESRVKGRVAAWVTRCGHEIVFRGFVVDKMPDSVVDSLIAHEFAMALLMSRTPLGGDYALGDLDVWDLTREWGFDPSDYLSWKGKHKRRINRWKKEAEKDDVIKFDR